MTDKMKTATESSDDLTGNPYRVPASDLHTANQHYVGFWARVLAAIIDSIFTAMVMMPTMYIVFGARVLGLDSDQQPGTLYSVLSVVIPAIIVVIFWIKKAATPGKMLIRAVIVDSVTGGKPALIQWVIRYVGYFISMIPFGLGLLWVGWDARKQGWHDKMAKTVVVRKD